MSCSEDSLDDSMSGTWWATSPTFSTFANEEENAATFGQVILHHNILTHWTGQNAQLLQHLIGCQPCKMVCCPLQWSCDGLRPQLVVWLMVVAGNRTYCRWIWMITMPNTHRATVGLHDPALFARKAVACGGFPNQRISVPFFLEYVKGSNWPTQNAENDWWLLRLREPKLPPLPLRSDQYMTNITSFSDQLPAGIGLSMVVRMPSSCSLRHY